MELYQYHKYNMTIYFLLYYYKNRFKKHTCTHKNEFNTPKIVLCYLSRLWDEMSAIVHLTLS